MRTPLGRTITVGIAAMTIGLAAAPIVARPTRQARETRAVSVESKEAALKKALFDMRDAIDRFYAEKRQYPANLSALVSARFMKSIPPDPMTNRTSTWRTVPAAADAARPATPRGIYDVKSGSRLMAADGTKYSQW